MDVGITTKISSELRRATFKLCNPFPFLLASFRSMHLVDGPIQLLLLISKMIYLTNMTALRFD